MDVTQSLESDFMESELVNADQRADAGTINPRLALRMADKRIGVLIVDEHPVVQEGISALVQSQADLRVVAKVQEGATAARLIEELAPDIVLFDLGAFPPESIRQVFTSAARCPSTRIIIFTASQSEEHIYQAIHAGARGYL